MSTQLLFFWRSHWVFRTLELVFNIRHSEDVAFVPDRLLVCIVDDDGAVTYLVVYNT